MWKPSNQKPEQPMDCVAYLSLEVQKAAYPHLDAYEPIRWNGEAWEVPDVMLGIPFLWVPARHWPCPLPEHRPHAR